MKKDKKILREKIVPYRHDSDDIRNIVDNIIQQRKEINQKKQAHEKLSIKHKVIRKQVKQLQKQQKQPV